jgi:putative ABC transport system permease protein
MNVLEQTRELGVLRAIGLKRGQVGKLVLSQALAVGVISLLPGVLLGLVAAYLQNLVTYPLQGHPVPFQINLPFLSGCCIVALACTVLAAFLPARRAARLQVIRALQYE